MAGDGSVVEVEIEDFPTSPGDPLPSFSIRRVSRGYFETIGIALDEGRTFDVDDHERRLGTAIVSASFKDQFWPDTTTLGERMDVVDPSTIVGVVGDVHGRNLTSPPEPLIYLPMLDAVGGGVRGMTLALRTSGEPLDLVPLARHEVAEMDPLLPISNVRRMSDIVGESMSRVTFTLSLLAIAALVALFLGSVGIFGVISYVVTQRTPEIGIRQALGAAPKQVWGLVMGRAMMLTLAGIVVGLIGALWTVRSFSTLVYEIDPYDPASFVAGSLVFMTVAAVASFLPALRAARIQPSVALRQE
ncbi:MAG: FtsX-like permease family protein [Gemmatimonas sp.]|nr:FtsX-like permease family protein [Gemmatimonas sp.]